MSKLSSGSIQFNRSVSIFANKKQFNTDNAELNFAKDYNSKLYSSGVVSKSLSQKQFLDLKSNFQDEKHKEILKENLRASQQIKFNSPNYKRENPITFEGKEIKPERSGIAKTPLYNIDNISYNTTKNEIPWKPCIKRIEIKLSDNLDEKQKRQLKSSEVSQLMNSSQHNPLFGGYEKQNFKLSHGGNGDQKISQQYQKISSIKLELPSQRKFDLAASSSKSEANLRNVKPIEKREPADSSQKSTNIQSLLSYGYGADFKYKELTTKPNLMEKQALIESR